MILHDLKFSQDISEELDDESDPSDRFFFVILGFLFFILARLFAIFLNSILYKNMFVQCSLVYIHSVNDVMLLVLHLYIKLDAGVTY